MNNIVLVQIIHGAKDLLDGLRSILLGELALLRDSIEQLSSRRELSDDVVLVLNTGRVSLDGSAGLSAVGTHNVLSIRTNRQT